MGCASRPGPQAAIAYFAEQTGVALTQEDWHYLKRAVSAETGEPVSRKRAESIAAAEAAISLVQSLDIEDSPEAKDFVDRFYNAVNTQSTVDTVNYLAAGGAPDEVRDRKRKGDGQGKGGAENCPFCGEFMGEGHACTPKKTPEEKMAEAEARLLAGVEQITSGEEFKNALDFAANIHHYSFGNSLMLMFDHGARHRADPENVPADPGVFQAFNKWKAADRFVMKGQHGYPILVPNMRTARYYLDDSGKRVDLKYKEAAPKGKEIKTFQYLDKKTPFLVGTTFAQYQTDGEPVPSLPKPTLLKGESVEGLRDNVETLLWGAGYKVEYVDPSDKRLGGANGVTRLDSKEVLVRNDVDDFQRDKTLVHEFAHVTLHADTNEYHHRGLGEVQAEAAAYLTFKTLADFDTDDYSMPYIAGWSSSLSSDPKERAHKTRAALNDVSKVTKAITEMFNADGGK